MPLVFSCSQKFFSVYLEAKNSEDGLVAHASGFIHLELESINLFDRWYSPNFTD